MSIDSWELLDRRSDCRVRQTPGLSVVAMGASLLLIALLITAPLAGAADTAPAITLTPLPAPAESEAIPLYPKTAASTGAKPLSETWSELGMTSGRQRIVRNVTRPTLAPVFPDRDKASGTAVIVAPGGGYLFLSIDSEGYEVARWLARRGIAAFVLKYRIDATPDDAGEFARLFVARIQGVAKGERLDNAEAVADARQAVSLVRHNAARWGLDPKRIGLLGFSAGARTALAATLAANDDSRPDFLGLIYPSMAAADLPAGLPPLFVGLAANDPLYGNRGFALVERWQQAGNPVELHYYDKGSHGFGMKRQGTSSDRWIDEFLWWLEARGLSPARRGELMP